jgi:hypothetical protein
MEADEFQRSRDPIGGGHGTDAGPWLDTQIRNFGLSLRGAGSTPRSPTPNIAGTPETSSFTGSTNRSPNSHGRESAYADPLI